MVKTGPALNPQERDHTRAYRLIEHRLTRLEKIAKVLDLGSATLSTTTTATTVSVTDLTSTDKVYLSPASASAIAANGWAYVSSIASGQFTLAHSSNSVTDRVYDWFAVRPGQ